MADLPEVLFVCVHNAGRSQMAAGLLHHHAGGRVRVTSAGSAPADGINPAVRQVMDEIGIDLSREFPKKLTKTRSRPPTSSSPWAAATPAPCSRASATSTGGSTTPPAWTSTRSAPSATRSTPGSGGCSPS